MTSKGLCRSEITHRPHTVLVIGALGMLGHMISRVLSDAHSIIGTSRSHVSLPENMQSAFRNGLFVTGIDGTEFGTVLEVVNQTEPSIIINCAGLIKHKIGKTDSLSAILINSVFPHRLAHLCKERDIRLIQFSTDCVFEGLPGIKSLDDVPDATDLYGLTKRLGEVDHGPALTLRTSFIGRQLAGKEELVEWAISQKGKTIYGFCKALYSGLTTQALALIVKTIIEQHTDLFGLFQVASKPITKFELLTELNERLRLNLSIKEDVDFECDRRLDASDFIQKTGIDIPNWNEMLAKFCEDQTFYETI
jgi:dTDP-4-dehydrorhamnose reductase